MLGLMNMKPMVLSMFEAVSYAKPRCTMDAGVDAGGAEHASVTELHQH